MDLEAMIKAWESANAYAVETDEPAAWAVVDDWGDVISQKLVEMTTKEKA